MCGLGLDIKSCCGQGYDGAGLMTGFRNGCAANILRINKKILYTHWFVHRFKLAVSSTSKIMSVDNVMAEIRKISELFGFSEQRQLAFEKKVRIFCPQSARNKIKDPCRTRWIERIAPGKLLSVRWTDKPSWKRWYLFDEQKRRPLENCDLFDEKIYLHGK